jgi:acyl-CoA synthetase (AMP-forming)/AMP-acid ligase II
MLYTNIIEPYIRVTMQNPDLTVARIGDQVYSYAQFAQRIAPIMNELDALSIPRTGIVMKTDLTACAALFACLFSGVVAVPLQENLSETQLQKVREELQLPEVLTVERMHYYYRMTFEDALNRIDNGLYQIEDEQLVSIRCHFGANESPTFDNLYAKDFPKSKPFSLAPVFQQLIPDFPEICSIF